MHILDTTLPFASFPYVSYLPHISNLNYLGMCPILLYATILIFIAAITN
jgi:hypothetical protein